MDRPAQVLRSFSGSKGAVTYPITVATCKEKCVLPGPAKARGELRAAANSADVWWPSKWCRRRSSYCLLQIPFLLWATAGLRSQRVFNHSSPSYPLKVSMYAFRLGRPGRCAPSGCREVVARSNQVKCPH